MPDAAALVSLAVLRRLGGGGHGSDGQVDCCVCDRSGATLLWLWLADLVALVVRHRLGGSRPASSAGVALMLLCQWWCGAATADGCLARLSRLDTAAADAWI